MLNRAEADGTWHIEYDAREGFDAEEAHVDLLSKSARGQHNYLTQQLARQPQVSVCDLPLPTLWACMQLKSF